MVDQNWVSLLPILTALILAFKTKNAVFSLLIGCIIGVVIAGDNPISGLASLFTKALSNETFIWVLLIEIAVGILIALYMRAGVIADFTKWASNHIHSRRAASGLGWLLGVFIFFSDYFSPIFGGTIARPITDKHKVSREMLAYTLDSGSAPVITLLPFTGWAVYVAGLMVGHGSVASLDQGVGLYVEAIFFNFYSLLAVTIAGLVAFGFIPLFGPMRQAEARAINEGKVIRDGATPLSGEDIDDIATLPDARSSLLFYLVIPVMLILGIAMGTFILLGSAKTLEAFFSAVMYLAIAMMIGGHFSSIRDGMEIATKGIKAVLPAILILALAYAINSISTTLGAPEVMIDLTRGWMTEGLLPVMTFLTAALISFFTGTAWGTYAIMIPFTLPIAFELSGGEPTSVVIATVGAFVGGAVFGDHCSPVSDTTMLSSFGARSDHMDHVVTQIPFALLAASLAAILYLIV